MNIINKLNIKPKTRIAWKDYNELLNKIEEHYPKFNVKYKNESSLMKVLGLVLFFAKSFMTRYTTTIRNTVFFPSRKWLIVKGPVVAYTILLHEAQHIYDANKYPIFFELSYLLFLPIGFTFRAFWEWRAYKVTLWMNYHLTGYVTFDIVRWLVKIFTGPAYLFMFPFPKIVRKAIWRFIRKNKIQSKLPFI